MKKFIYFLIFVLMVSTVSAISMTRILPDTASPESSFEVTYQVDGATESYGVLIEDDISGGCEFVGDDDTLRTGFLGPPNSVTLEVSTPSSGACTFTGNYQFAIDTTLPETDLGADSITISSASTTTSTGSTSSSTKVCYFIQKNSDDKSVCKSTVITGSSCSQGQYATKSSCEENLPSSFDPKWILIAFGAYLLLTSKKLLKK